MFKIKMNYMQYLAWISIIIIATLLLFSGFSVLFINVFQNKLFRVLTLIILTTGFLWALLASSYIESMYRFYKANPHGTLGVPRVTLWIEGVILLIAITYYLGFFSSDIYP